MSTLIAEVVCHLLWIPAPHHHLLCVKYNLIESTIQTHHRAHFNFVSIRYMIIQLEYKHIVEGIHVEDLISATTCLYYYYILCSSCMHDAITFPPDAFHPSLQQVLVSNLTFCLTYPFPLCAAFQRALSTNVCELLLVQTPQCLPAHMFQLLAPYSAGFFNAETHWETDTVTPPRNLALLVLC